MNRYQRLFQNDNGKKFGDFMEELISRICGFVESTDGCDRKFQKYRIECKAMRSVAPMGDTSTGSISEMLTRIEKNTMARRALYSVDGNDLWGETKTNQFVWLADSCFCQQTKPDNFDYLVATNVFLDKMRVYIIPSSEISPRVGMRTYGKLSMTPQHGNDAEGVLTLGKVFDYHAFDITDPIDKLDALSIDASRFMMKRRRIA